MRSEKDVLEDDGESEREMVVKYERKRARARVRGRERERAQRVSTTERGRRGLAKEATRETGCEGKGERQRGEKGYTLARGLETLDPTDRSVSTLARYGTVRYCR